MKALSRILLGIGIVVSLGLASMGSAAAARHASGPAYYLALGDSVAAGYQNPAINTDRSCTNTTADLSGNAGYSCLLYRYMAAGYPGMVYANLGLAVSTAHGAGEDSCSFGGIKNCEGDMTRTDSAPGDTAPWAINSVSQLTEAEGFISTHNVKVISLNLGGNDFLPLLSIAQLPNCSVLPPPYTPYENADCAVAASGILANITAPRLATNLETIVGTLRTVAPTATILLGDQYDPLAGLPAPALGSNGAEILALASNALGRFQMLVQGIATATHSVWVDELDTVTDGPSMTWITSSQNIHPNSLGYTLLANEYWLDYVTSAGGERVSTKVKRGKSGHVSFKISTLPQSTVFTQISYVKHGYQSDEVDSTLTGAASTITQKWKAPKGVKKIQWWSCSSMGSGANFITMCNNGGSVTLK